MPASNKNVPHKGGPSTPPKNNISTVNFESIMEEPVISAPSFSKESNSYLFNLGSPLCTSALLDTASGAVSDRPRVPIKLIKCTNYSQTWNVKRDYMTTSNYFTHYKIHHPLIPLSLSAT